jgi:hypothetical protein
MNKFAAETVKSKLTTLLAEAASSGPDGLTVIPAGSPAPATKYVVELSDRLLAWLRDLRVLRHVPLAYLVPDPALLPPESIRFFHVDRTWADRLVDGAMSAANIGTVDMTFTAATLTDLRRMLDAELALTPTTPITGMLIRSELIERWPDLIVETLPAGEVPVIRQDALSRSLMIVLFAGTPTEVRLREPDVGLRFGVEANEQQHRYEVNLHNNQTGQELADTIEVKLTAGRVLQLTELVKHLKPPVPGDPTRSRDIAINLRQAPYVAVFRNTVPAAHGSEVAAGNAKLVVRGREVTVSAMLGARALDRQGDH